MKFILIALGGALGALARYGASGLVQRLSGGVFPWGTMAVNVLGSFAIGLLWELLQKDAGGGNLRMFVFIGLLGGFTTFSTFSVETMGLLRDSETRLALFNIITTNVLCVGFVFLGFFISRMIFR